METILDVRNVSKKFCRDIKASTLYGIKDIAKELLGRNRNDTLRPHEFHALRDVSFSIRRGQALGLVGPNGSGKTTLLRVISGLIKPDAGRVEVRGMTAPLLALGAGFNPILTGRENIHVNMAILGLDQKRIDERLEQVLEFAEIGDAIDAPVQTYSSGMNARLGFACAVHTDPDILLMDEVLSVGDMSFRMKCYRRLAELRRSGTSFVLVSHNPSSILSFCDTALYLNRGRLLADGPTERIMQKYEEDLLSRLPSPSHGELRLPAKASDAAVEIRSVRLTDGQGQNVESWMSGSPVAMRIRGFARRPLRKTSFNVIVRELASEYERVLTLDSAREGHPFDLNAGEFEAVVRFPSCGLKPSTYSAKIFIAGEHFDMFDAVESYVFRVTSDANFGESAYYQPREWELR